MQSLIKVLYDEVASSNEYAKEEEQYVKDDDAARERLVHNSEDEYMFTAIKAEQNYFGFVQGFKCAMRLKKECEE